jgi:hypothetical protein
MAGVDCIDHSRGDRDNQEGCNEKFWHLSRSLIHGMQPSNHDGLHDISEVNIIEVLQLGSSPVSIVFTTKDVQHSAMTIILPKNY